MSFGQDRTPTLRDEAAVVAAPDQASQPCKHGGGGAHDHTLTEGGRKREREKVGLRESLGGVVGQT